MSQERKLEGLLWNSACGIWNIFSFLDAWLEPNYYVYLWFRWSSFAHIYTKPSHLSWLCGFVAADSTFSAHLECSFIFSAWLSNKSELPCKFVSIDWVPVSSWMVLFSAYSALQIKLDFLEFSYKISIDTRVEKYLNVM